MKELNEIMGRLQALKELEEVIEEEVKRFVADKSKPLEIRWNLFCNSGMGTHESYLQDVGFIDSDWLCGDELGRNSKVSLQDQVERVEEDPEEYPEITEKMITETKEEILKRFIKSFDYDW